MARRIFKEEGVPQDLVFLAHVESAFKVNALSSARALGLWQFMRGTAKLYGLRCDAYVDERLDPEKATRASARHLRDLYNRYGDWYLALAAYNAGAGNVDRAIQRTGVRDFWQLSQSRYLVYETRNFVPAILAATIIAKSPGAYGFTEETDPPLAYDTVIVDEPIDLRVVARYSGATLTELERLNTALLLNQTPPLAEKYELRVPVGFGDAFARRLAEVPTDERLLCQHHKVKSGENLAMVAARYGTTVRAVQDANRMGKSTLIRAGQSLLIPGRGAPTRNVRDQFEWNGKDALTHRVRRGDTLSRIAGLYNVPATTIQAANDLKNPNCLSVGQQLTIPVAGKASDSETAAQAEPDPAPAAIEPGTPPVVVPATRSMLAQNNSEALGRVPSTAHIVARARLEIGNATAAGSSESSSAAAIVNDGPAASGKSDAKSKTAGAASTTYRVRRGDTLGKIASRFGVNVAQLRDWNRVRGGNLIYPGQVLRVARPADAASRTAPAAAAVAAASHQRASQAASQPRDVHIVRRGDSLWKISKRYGVSTSELMRKNSLGPSSTLQPGQRIALR
jgi:LysM repeat protein